MDQERLNEAKQIIMDIVSTQYPDADIRKGTVLNELVIGMAALGYAVIYSDIKNIEDRLFIENAFDNPSSIDPSVLDAIISNFFISRASGNNARGILKVEFNKSSFYNFSTSDGFFTTDGLIFYPGADISISPESLIKQEDEDSYYYFIEVVSENPGSNYLLQAGTILESSIYSGYIESVTAFEDFEGGIDEESNDDLINRVRNSIGTRGLFSKQAINSILFENFPYLRQVTVIGYNDREMQRDINNIGLKVGGKADIYVRTDNSPVVKLIETISDVDGYVTISGLPILRIRKIVPLSDLTRFYTNFTYEVLSDHGSPEYYRFSTKEKIRIKVPDDIKYTQIIIEVDTVNEISELQDFVNSEDNNYILSDLLVRSFMPCFVKVPIIYYSEISDTNMESTIKSTISNYINSLNSDVLYVSKMIDLLHNLNIRNIELPLTVSGEFHFPDGVVKNISSDNNLKISQDYLRGYSERTFRFFVSTSDISVTKKSN